MEYLSTLGISELIMYLEVNCQSSDFMNVERVLLSREKEMAERAKDTERKMAEHANDLEKEMTKRTSDLEKGLEMCKGRCSKLSSMVEAGNAKSIVMEGKLAELKQCKMICSELESKVVSLLSDLENVSKKRSEEVIEFKTKYKDLACAKLKAEEEIEGQKMICRELESKVANLSSDLENVTKKRSEEVIEFKTKYEDLECAKFKAEEEIEDQKRKIIDMGKNIKDLGELEKEFVKYKAKCLELSNSLEENKKAKSIVEGLLNNLRDYKKMSNELKEQVDTLQKNSVIIKERETRALQHLSKLSADYELVIRKKSEEVSELKKKNKELECSKQKADDETEMQKKRYEELEKMLKKESDLEKMLKKESDLENELNICKATCSVLSNAFELKSKDYTALEGKLEKMKECKLMCDKLKKEVTRLREDYVIISEREKFAVQSVTNLSADLEKFSMSKDEELAELKTRNRNLDCAKLKAEEEIDDQRRRLKDMEKKIEDTIELEKDLERCKSNCSDLVMELQEKTNKIIALEGEHEELREYKLMSDELKLKNNDLKSAKQKAEYEIEVQKERFKELEGKTSHTIEFEKELRECKLISDEHKLKNIDLESAKEKEEYEIDVLKERFKELEEMKSHAIELQKDLESYKAKCSQLSIALEKKKKMSNSMQGKLEMFHKYKTVCNELKAMVARLEEDSEVVSEREKTTSERINHLMDDVQNGDRFEELNKPNKKNNNLRCVKQKAEGEAKFHKKRYKRVQNQVMIKNESSALICQLQVSEKPSLEGGADVSRKEEKKDASTPGEIQSKTSQGVTGDFASKLKFKLKTTSCEGDGRVRDSVSADSICHSAVKDAGGRKVEVTTFKRKRKRTRKIVSCDGGDEDDQTQSGKAMMACNTTQASGVHHHSESLGNQSPTISHGRKIVSCDGGDGDDQTRNVKAKMACIAEQAPGLHHLPDSFANQSPTLSYGPHADETLHPSSNHSTSRQCEDKKSGASYKDSENSVAENVKDKEVTSMRHLRRNVHPPDRLNL